MSGKRIRPPAECGGSAAKKMRALDAFAASPADNGTSTTRKVELDDEIGFQLGEERFVTGEYVSIGRTGVMHTYQVARVEKP